MKLLYIFSLLCPLEILDMLSFFWKLWRLVLCLIVCSIFENVLCAVCVNGEKCSPHISCVHWIQESVQSHITIGDVLFGDSVNFCQWEVQTSQCECVAVNVVIQSSKISVLYLGAPIFCVCTLTLYMAFLLDCFPQYYVSPPACLSLPFLCHRISSDRLNVNPAFLWCLLSAHISGSQYSFSLCRSFVLRLFSTGKHMCESLFLTLSALFFHLVAQGIHSI